MLKQIKINGFRAFKHLEVDGLTRVNLIVGKNNCGKTSLLEAVQLLASKGDISVLLELLKQRREFGPSTAPSVASEVYDVSQLFVGRRISFGSVFTLQGHNDESTIISCMVKRGGDDPLDASELSLSVQTNEDHPISIPLTEEGGLQEAALRRGIAAVRSITSKPVANRSLVLVVPTEGLQNGSLSVLWDRIALTPRQQEVIEALRLIDGRIENIAFLTKANIVVKLSGEDMPAPLGSCGDGVKRLLGLSISSVQASNGFLIVDEIDTGLHYTVMEKLWKLIVATAVRLNLQVFATTHSQDCLVSLGRLHESEPDLAAHASVHRLESDLPHSIRYGADEILTAADQSIEVR